MCLKKVFRYGRVFTNVCDKKDEEDSVGGEKKQIYQHQAGRCQGVGEVELDCKKTKERYGNGTKGSRTEENQEKEINHL